MATADPHNTGEGRVPADSGAEPGVPTAEELRKALKAFKKRLKLARLDDESRLGHGAMTGGGKSGIIAVPAPRQYPQSVWDELVKQGRLKHSGQGLYELAPPPDKRS